MVVVSLKHVFKGSKNMSSTSLVSRLKRFSEVNDFVFNISMRFFRFALSELDKPKTLTRYSHGGSYAFVWLTTKKLQYT